MYLLIKDNLVVESSQHPIIAAQDGDYFVSLTRHHYDPRPSSGVVVIEADFPEESFCTYQMVNGTPSLINPPIPQSVSPRQIRQALTRAGLRASVEAAVAAGDQDTKDWYEFATAFERSNPVVAELGAALNVSDAQLDDLWILAASL